MPQTHHDSPVFGVFALFKITPQDRPLCKYDKNKKRARRITCTNNKLVIKTPHTIIPILCSNTRSKHNGRAFYDRTHEPESITPIFITIKYIANKTILNA